MCIQHGLARLFSGGQRPVQLHPQPAQLAHALRDRRARVAALSKQVDGRVAERRAVEDVDEGAPPDGVGPIDALKRFVGRRPSAADSAAAAAATAAVSDSPKGKFTRRRGSNATSDQIQSAAAS